jgi:16S rRNA (uracil1498-N3)-methyltransferase
LRLRRGNQLLVFNGRGTERQASVESLQRRGATLALAAALTPLPESILDLTLVQALPKSDAMDLIVQKATELGVTRILPVLAERSVVKVDASKSARKLEHWRSIAISACEQCGRNRVPEVAEPLALGDSVRALEAGTARYLLAAGARDSLSAAMIRDAGKPVVLLIGPEGGLADAERDFAGAHGFTACAMGPRILRTETAGLAALAVLQTVAGDFR